MTDRTISILIAEDDPLLRNFLTEVLHQQPDLQIVGCHASGREVLAALAAPGEPLPEVLLLDLHLRELSGWKVLEALAERPAAPRVLVLSGDEDPETMLQ
ncbi:MAG TPA: response regulator, partial [Armatimonadota bacterium]|nr:response regulator [Armatimonadota bacterium]